MSLPISDELKWMWASGNHTGAWRPRMEVKVRRGYLQRVRKPNGKWTADWTPMADYVDLPGVERCSIEQSFDSNGIATCTIDMANLAYIEVLGAAGIFHQVDPGHFGPYRAYRAPHGPAGALGLAPNEWANILATAAQVTVWQGYGDELVRTFTGLLDSVGGPSFPPTLTLVARDFGQLLTDCHPFGWNIDPDLRDPITFFDKSRNNALWAKGGSDRQTAERRRKKWVLIDDVSDAVSTILTWAGLPNHTVRKTGASFTDAVPFGLGEFLIDVIRKAQDFSGYTFFIGEPTSTFPLGQPIFRRSKLVTTPAPTAEVTHKTILTGLNWQRSDEPLAGIIRVRGKAATAERGGRTLGNPDLHGSRVMGVYRPPWHTNERDARLIRHVVHEEDLYETEEQCLVAAQMIALQEALAACTATIEIPTHPGLQLDDIIAVRDMNTGLSTRCWIASKQATFEAGATTRWTQSLGVSLLDTPDVVQVLDDLGPLLRYGLPETPLPPNTEEGEGEIPTRYPPPTPNTEVISVG